MFVASPNRRSFQVLDVERDTNNTHEIDEFIKDSRNGCKLHTKIYGCGFISEYSLIMENMYGRYDVNPGAKLIKNHNNEVCVLSEEQYKILFK